MPTACTDDLHLHLYGCLTAEDLWTLGRDRWRQLAPRLAWYSAEYAKAYGRTPNPAAYWQCDDGLERLTKDFLFTEAAPFACFQASFNLAIALFPASAADTAILQHVLRAQREAGIRYAEYRTFLPPHLAATEAAAYIKAVATTCLHIDADSGGSYQPRLAFSLSRLPAVGLVQYRLLQGILAQHPAFARVVTGIDFCGGEEGHPPAMTAPLIAAIQAGNAADPKQALAVLVHVGESFTDKTLMSACRWVWEAHAAGAQRLGHALAIGMAPEVLHGQEVTETVEERLAHIAWLRQHAAWLGARGYGVDARALAAEAAGLRTGTATVLRMTYDEHVVADCRRLQDALLGELAARGAVVESCPTSNLRIGQLPVAAHPLPRFLAAGLTTVLASDDPGILGITLRSEEAFVRERLGLTQMHIERLQAAAVACRSEVLTGRA